VHRVEQVGQLLSQHFLSYFFGRVAPGEREAGTRFIAITDPGSH
jgi:hypothetical protein